MRKGIYIALLSIMTLSFLFGIIACQSGEPSFDESTVRAYADPATEVTLQGLSEGNLEKYAQHGNDAFKDALTPELFDEMATQVNSQLGDYESKEFLSVEEQDDYVIVHYRAKFENVEVGVRMVFDEDQQVAGQWFE